MSSKDNTANSDIPDINIPTWFKLHRLPYNDVIVTKLHIIGKYLCVEDIKLFKPHHIEALFGDEDYIVMLRAELAWEDWVEGTNTASRSPTPISRIRPRRTLTPPALSALHHHQQTRRKLTSFIIISCHIFFKFGFSTKVTKKKAEKIR